MAPPQQIQESQGFCCVPSPLQHSITSKQAILIKNTVIALALVVTAGALYLQMPPDYVGINGNAHADGTMSSEIESRGSLHPQVPDRDFNATTTVAAQLASPAPHSNSDGTGYFPAVAPNSPRNVHGDSRVPNPNSPPNADDRDAENEYGETRIDSSAPDYQAEKEKYNDKIAGAHNEAAAPAEIKNGNGRAPVPKATKGAENGTAPNEWNNRKTEDAPAADAVKARRNETRAHGDDDTLAPGTAERGRRKRKRADGTDKAPTKVDNSSDGPSGRRPAGGVRSSGHPIRPDSKWPLSRLEKQLYAAAREIENAPPSTSLHGVQLNPSLYHNVSRFIKSYELMEKMFRVYVYKEGRGPLVHTGPVLGIYASEGLFIRQMERGEHPFTAASPAEALAFFLPFSVANMVDSLYEPGSRSMHGLSSFISRYISRIAAAHPFWNRTRGADHFFVACHDWGPLVMLELEEQRSNVMKVVCNADTTGDFRYGRDASLPEFYMHEEVSEEGNEVGRRVARGGRRTEKLPEELSEKLPEEEEREALAFFAGQMHGRVRPRLLELWRYPKGGEQMQIYGVLRQEEENGSKYTYEEHLKRSKFCICAAGYEVNSPRIVEAMAAGCVPVVIADGFVLPFSDVLDWSAFSVTLPESRLPFLKADLLAVEPARYDAMRRRLPYLLRTHFSWHSPRPRPLDAFHMILHSVWSARLHNLTSSSSSAAPKP